jgi:nucleoside-diphosphate-sugar epimerase
MAAEALVHAHRHAFTPVVLRPFFIYGVGQHRDMLLPRLCDTIRAGRPVHLTGHDGLVISPTHASDAARCVMRALDLTAPATINVRGPEVLSLRAMCDRLGTTLGIPPQFVCTNEPAPTMVADDQLMTSRLGAAVGTFDALHPTILS